MILTDDDLMELDGFDYDEPQFIAEKKFARAIEAAILKKIGKPLAWHHEEEGLSYENHYSGNVPLYKLPEVKE